MYAYRTSKRTQSAREALNVTEVGIAGTVSGDASRFSRETNGSKKTTAAGFVAMDVKRSCEIRI